MDGPYSRFRTAVVCCWIGGELEGEAYPNWAVYIRDPRDRASVCAGRDALNERNALPGLWRQRTTALDLDHGSLTLFSILLNALPFIHSIPSKSP